jgi:hypothetical protein
MTNASALRREIEHALEHRFPAALTPAQKTIHETYATGIAAVDALLEGGLPVGAISEVTGPECSGRTSLALSLVAGRTREGQVCAWVDAEDALDPESAAACGVSLRQLLWVRCRRVAGTGKVTAKARMGHVDQALRATDLLLAAGGFAAIVLDLGGTAVEDARRIPLATWFRFRQAADRARSCVVVLGRASYAQSSAAAVLKCAPLRALTAGGTVLRGFEYSVARERQRFVPGAAGGRKPPASTWNAPWSATGAWVRGERG